MYPFPPVIGINTAAIEDQDMVVEDNPLLAVYAGWRAGRVAEATTMHHRNTTDLVLIAHKKPAAGQTFTCNTQYTPSDPGGVSMEEPGPAASHMLDLPLESAAMDLPSPLLEYLVNRYTEHKAGGFDKVN